MKFEVGDICELRNGDFVRVKDVRKVGLWVIVCEDNIKTNMLFNENGGYDLEGKTHKWDIIKIYKKEEYPEYYV